jgi:hypothetical protein
MTSRPAIIGGSLAAAVVLIAAVALRLEGTSPSGRTAIFVFVLLAVIAAAAAMLFVHALPKRLGSFGATFLVAIAATAPLFSSGLFAGFPLIGTLWQRGDPSRHIVSLIFLTTFWLAIRLFQRLMVTLAERRVLAQVTKKLADEQKGLDWGTLLPADGVLQATSAWQRIELLRQQKIHPELAAQMVAERAHADDVAMQSVYAPLRALVWALPALGFIGTAATMARSITGIGSAVGGGGSQQQLRALTDVVPNLGDAFNITLVALASTIACFFALSLVHAYEEKTTSELQSLVLGLIGKIETTWPRAEGEDPVGRLLVEMWSLECELARLRGPIAEFVRGNGSALTLAELLLRMTIELKALNQTAAAHARALTKLTAVARSVKP